MGPSPRKGRRSSSTTPMPHQPPLPPSTHDAACDQCRIKKVRCGRQQPCCANCEQSKLECSWTNKGKRPNQTKKLVDDFEKLGDRLGGLEAKVDRLASTLQELPSQLKALQTEPPRTNRFDNLRHLNISSRNEVHDAEGISGSGHIVQETDGSQRYHGPGSLFALIVDSDATITRNLQSRASLKDILLGADQNPDPPSWDAFFAYKDKVYRGLAAAFMTPRFLPEMFSDGLPPMLPPRVLLDSLLDSYFQHMNFLPLVGREPTEEAIQKYYDVPAAEPNLAWVIIFNYIVIRCLAGRHMPLEQPIADTRVLDADQFEQPFVINIRRALPLLDKFMKPELVNVQGLCAMAILSPKYFPVHITHMLCERSCSLAKTMGLHQDRASTSVPSTFDRRFTLGLLFTMDKNISLLVGVPPSLPAFDCDVSIPTCLSGDQRQRFQACIITERVQIRLYSSSSCKMSDEQREDVVVELERDLEELNQIGEQMNPEDPSSGWRGRPFLQLELKYTYHQLRVMVLRCSKNAEKRRQCLEEARRCISILATIQVAKTTIGGVMILRRPYQWHCFAPFFELFASLFTYPPPETQLEDRDLLRSSVSNLQEVAGMEPSYTYSATLLQITKACLDVADLFIKQCHSHVSSQSPPGPAVAQQIHTRIKRKLTEIDQGLESEYTQSRPQRQQTAAFASEAWVQNVLPVRDDGSVMDRQYPVANIPFDRPDQGHTRTADPFFGMSNVELHEMARLNEDMMWGNEDISAAVQRPLN